MPIQDIAGNAFLTQSTPMLGFVESVSVDAQPLRLRMYFFLLENIRIPDQMGDKFVERYLRGPETIWDRINATIRSLPILWNVADIPDAFLPFMKRIVGWTPDLDSITNNLEPQTLRRLIGTSVPFWKRRGPEDTILDVLRLVNGARARIWNWFDYRIICNETAMGEDWNGFDPWMVSLPGPPNFDDMRFNVRIVDDGTLDRQIVRDLVRLTRPSGERVEISYIGFLDTFDVDDDDSQWDASGNTVEDGMMALAPAGGGQVSVAGATDWDDYVVFARVRGAYTFQFYWTSVSDYYFALFDVPNNRIRVGRVVAGVTTFLDTVDMFVALGVFLQDDVFYALRIEATPEGSSTRIRVLFESNLLSSVLDSNHTSGTIGLVAGATAVDVDEVEMFFNPLETDLIDINS